MSNFHPIEVLGRRSETQLQVGVNLNKITGKVTLFWAKLFKGTGPG